MSSAARATPMRALAEAAALAVVAVGVLLDSRSYPGSLTEGAPGPAFFPRLLATLLIGCAVWLALRARPWRSRGNADSADTGHAREGAGTAAAPPERSRGNVDAAGARGSEVRAEASSGAPRRSRWNVFRGIGARNGATGRGAGLGLAVAWIAAFLLVWPRLGTVLSVPLLVGGLMWLTGERSRAVLIAVPLAFAGFIYLVFMVVLGVPLPAGF